MIAAGFLAGYMESHKLTVRVEKLEAFLRFLSSSRAEIRYSSMPVESILKLHGEGISFFSGLQGAGGSGNWKEMWQQAVAEHAAGEGFSRKDIDLLNGFGTGFGSSDTESQVAHFKLYETLTATAVSEARAERDRKAKLYLMLGVFGGMAAAILLC